MGSLSKQQILDFIRDAAKPVTKREIARAFGIKGGDGRVALKQILKQIESDGLVAKQPGGAYSVPEGLPAVGVLLISDIDIDGDVFARPLGWDDALQGEPPRIEIMPGKKGHPSFEIGDRVLARLMRGADGTYEARIIKVLPVSGRAGARGQVLGLVRVGERGMVLHPSDKKAKYDFEIAQSDSQGAKDGDLALGEILDSRGVRNKKVRIIEILGRRDDPGAISLISLHEAGLRKDFPDRVLAETKGLKVPPLEKREDLRVFPLVTIDGADARDFDDAVFAERLEDGEGFHLIVAIADVASYVRPGSALDKEAQLRGNSTYFPDRVVPMLPEALSNDLCSLRPDEDRACLAVHMWIDAEGHLHRYQFVRGLMRSRARLTYEEVQGVFNLAKKGQYYDIVEPLYAAFRILEAARQKRGALDLDLPERQILIDDQGQMSGVKQRVRLDSHKLIEEFMILANVAAAKALESKKDPKRFPCVYRVHEPPSADKLDSARTFLESFSLSLPKGHTLKPAQINGLLHKAAKLPFSHLVSTVILRTQSQARYSPKNQGHFGLALESYAHFTSPIRRYADLLVHRALIAAFGLGEGGLVPDEIAALEEICERISGCERTSMEAERNAIDRFTASFLSERIGAEFPGRISGVTRFGLFVTLDESGADGLVPVRSLPRDFYIHNEEAHALVGRSSGRVYRLGADVNVRLLEANRLTGSTVFELAGHEDGADIPGMPLKSGFSGRRGSQRGQASGRSGKGGKKTRYGGVPRKGKRKLS
ncbi:MAG: ribonuclease R [Alphaproteobacteria bacterium]|nr:ribonuclease R [Alphaproteobacteria bacterium]